MTASHPPPAPRLSGIPRAGRWHLAGAAALTLLWLTVRSLAPDVGLSRNFHYPIGFSTAPLVEERITEVDLAFLDRGNRPTRNYLIRWQGIWFSPRAETVDFFAGADDGVAVRIDGEIILERNATVGMHSIRRTVQLDAGPHELQIDHWQLRGERSLSVGWAPAGGSPEPLAPSRLYPLAPSVAGYWLAWTALGLPMWVALAWAALPLPWLARSIRREVAARSGREPETRFRLEALHITGLWAVAVAQPLYGLLSGSPEFFVAHDTRPGDLVGLVALLGLAGPAGCLAVTRLARRLGPLWHALTIGAVTGALAALIALLAVKQTFAASVALSMGIAAACGVLAGAGYLLSTTARSFATFLSPAALVVPAVFLLQPAISPLLSAGEDEGPLEDLGFETTPPVVLVVFDQLPLASLLDRGGRIDGAQYPAFAALAGQATWFRNASAVSGWTQYALPAILTGNHPAPLRLPTADAHPDNLFTLLGSRYDVHAIEPLTALCPASICARQRPGATAWFQATLSDLVIVYLQAVLPEELTRTLPPVTQSWRDFVDEDTFLGRWNARRAADRPRTVTDYIAAIDPDPDGRPTLHFLHALLPHEPWLYLPGGQRYTLPRATVGLVDERWREDAWVEMSNYQRHLLQVQYVDALLGRLVERLREVGVYDDALVVVMADHGASLQAGLPFRKATDATFADIAAVPLLIKEPGQKEGRIADDNVETVDILPTLTGRLGVRPPWPTAGADAFDGKRAPRAAKTLFVSDGWRRIEGPADLADAVASRVARKFELFEAGDPLQPLLAPHRDIVGRPAAALQSDEPAGFRVAIDTAALLREVDLDADFLPAHVTGGVVTGVDSALIPPLAIALNGVVAAVTQAWPFRAYGHAVPWEAVVDPRFLRPGANTVGVFAVRETADGAVELQPAPAID